MTHRSASKPFSSRFAGRTGSGAVLLIAAAAFHAWVAFGSEPSSEMATDASPRYGEPRKVAELLDEDIDESSGVAASHRHAGVFWTHNDSGDGPRLYAFDRDGKTVARVDVQGATSVDWEDMSSFQFGGKSWLALADVGDNARRREFCTLYVVEEPELDQRHAAPKLTIRFRYEDGPHDCEAIAVDAAAGEVLLVSKVFGLSCRVYRVELDWKSRESKRTAALVASLSLPLATAADISSDGRRMLVATYLDGYEYSRRKDESWKDALSRKPRAVSLPRRAQGEAACYAADGRAIYLTSEKLPTPLWELPLQNEE
ncbi:MAG: hypothetical protein KDA47_20660 [Planctomycetales bacterium]|nr:hypothetical protein [Planctomycetales bacterium]